MQGPKLKTSMGSFTALNRREQKDDMSTQQLGWITNFIWGIADDVMTGQLDVREIEFPDLDEEAEYYGEEELENVDNKEES